MGIPCKTKAVHRKLFLEEEPQRKQTERGVSFKMNGDTFHKLVRDIQYCGKEEQRKRFTNEVSEETNKFQKAHDPSFEMEMTWFNRIN